MPSWLKDMIYQVSFGVDLENDTYNWFFGFKDLKRDLNWTNSECTSRVSWLIDNGYATRNYVEDGMKKRTHWRYPYVLTDKGMEIEESFRTGANH